MENKDKPEGSHEGKWNMETTGPHTIFTSNKHLLGPKFCVSAVLTK
jgi:hypothetical protein